jgi:hypothetical protein
VSVFAAVGEEHWFEVVVAALVVAVAAAAAVVVAVGAVVAAAVGVAAETHSLVAGQAEDDAAVEGPCLAEVHRKETPSSVHYAWPYQLDMGANCCEAWSAWIHKADDKSAQREG